MHIPPEAEPSPSLPACRLHTCTQVDDLRGRLESLEASLREMESKAVAHLDKSLQDKVLATAGEEPRGRQGRGGRYMGSSRESGGHPSLITHPARSPLTAHHPPAPHAPCLPLPAAAAKIVQKRFMADKQLDKKLEEHILRVGGAGVALGAWA